MALNASTLKVAIFNGIKTQLDSLFEDPESPPDRDDVWDAICDVISTEVVSHIVSNLEIKGITIDAGTPINTVVTAGVVIPQDGGANLKTTMIAAATPSVQGVQDNDGTGLVA